MAKTTRRNRVARTELAAIKKELADIELRARESKIRTEEILKSFDASLQRLVAASRPRLWRLS